MFRKFNIKQILIAFAILLALVLVIFITQPTYHSRSKALKENLFEGDTSQITKLSIYKKGDMDNYVSLVKIDGKWMVKSADAYYVANENQIKGILQTLAGLNPKRIAATTKDKWKEYQVTDSLSTRIIAETNKKVVCDLHIGKFSYQQPKNPSPYNYQQRGTMLSYVRLDKDKPVYAVEGFLSMMFNKSARDFRSATVLKSDYTNWTSINFKYPENNSFDLTNQNGKWLLNGIMADSTKVTNYLKTLSNLSSNGFVDDQKPLSDLAAYTLKIDGNNFTNSILINAFPATDTTYGEFITSTQNKGVYFSGKNAGLFNKIFKPKESFFPSEEMAIGK